MNKKSRKKGAKPFALRRSADLSQHIISVINSLPSDGGEFDAFNYLRSEMFSKHPSLEGGVSAELRRSLAIEKMLKSDSRCKAINEQGYTDYTHGILDEILRRARGYIGDVLFGFEEGFLDYCGFSNGASQGFKRTDAKVWKKISGMSTVTPSAYALAMKVIKLSPAWVEALTEREADESKWLTRVLGNGLFTVPKNSNIDRAAAKECDLNTYLQLGVGRFIKNRLKHLVKGTGSSRVHIGVDLFDQTWNQELARRGSVDDSLATIDLSSASDSISDRLVWDLLPPRVYEYLDMIRSHRAVMPDGTSHKWAMFSSMGNGFTFELETLIFWALAHACVHYLYGLRGDNTSISVYGDDIIVPSACAPLLLDVLKSVGFLPNTEKTFISGGFRESCGSHWFKGIDVRPFYVREPITTLPRIIHFCNHLRTWNNVNGVSDPRLFELWTELANRVPKRYWGGKNPESLTTLMTICSPKLSLTPVTTLSENFGVCSPREELVVVKRSRGSYVQWFLSKSWLGSREPLRRPSDGGLLFPVSSFLETEGSGLYTDRVNKDWWVAVPIFPQEM